MRSTDADSVRFDLLTPIGLRAVAKTAAEGAAKYGPNNYLRGFPVSDLLNHAINHINEFLGGGRAEPHLPHAAWNVLVAIHSLEKWPHLNRDLLLPGAELPEHLKAKPPETPLVLSRETPAQAKARRKRQRLAKRKKRAAAANNLEPDKATKLKPVKRASKK